jgi:hypothetical protein
MINSTFSHLSRVGLLICALAIIGSGAVALGIIQSLTSSRLAEKNEAMGYSATGASAPAMPARDQGLMIAEKSSFLPQPMPANQFRPGADRAIVKTGYLDVVVENPRTTTEKITELANAAGGAIVDTSISTEPGTSGATRATMSLRVPSTAFENTLKAVRELSQRIVRDQITSDDRTAQKIDLEASLRNLRASEEQLLTIMRQAKTVTETLEVQSQLTSVRSQIEQLAAQLENLNTDVEYSTIYLTLISPSSEAPLVGPEELSLTEELKLALRNTIRTYRNVAIGGLRIGILLFPLLIVGTVAWALKKQFSK